jgi:hypothetical protein
MFLVGETERNVPLGRPKRRWENVININFQEMGCRGMFWIEMTGVRDRWRALVNAVMNFWVQ